MDARGDARLAHRFVHLEGGLHRPLVFEGVEAAGRHARGVGRAFQRPLFGPTRCRIPIR
jgi:hypothetical protein